MLFYDILLVDMPGEWIILKVERRGEALESE